MPSPGVFSGRVGKRVILLFAACAFLPLWALAVLSMSQVRDLLIEQGNQRLAADAHDYALAVQERLRHARTTAQLLAQQPPGMPAIPRAAADQFHWMARAEPGTTLQPVFGLPTPDADRLAADYRSRANRPATQLAVRDDERLLLLFEAGTPRGQDLIAAELNPDYVWGSATGLGTGAIACVVDAANARLLRCPDSRELDLLAHVRGTPSQPAISHLAWTRNGEAYQGAVFRQPMRTEFGAGDWVFSVSVPESALVAAVDKFRRNFMLVVALAVLLIVAVSAGQIRAMVVPLARLTAGTRRIAENQFGTQVQVDSADEFGELGRAFNAMSSRLDRQFRVSQAYSEIDRMILMREKLDRIVEAMLRQFRALLPSLQVTAFLLDREDAHCARRLALPALPASNGGGAIVERIALSEQDRKRIPSGELAIFSPDLNRPEWCRAMGAVDTADPAGEWTQPLTWGDSTCGWLWLTGAADATIEADDRRIVADLAGRISLAVAAAWRDEQLYQQAHFDPLTGLPNRLLFSDRLQRELARSKRETKKAAVLFIDLDHFKSVNDAQGHGAGDQVLREAAARIGAAVREADTVSRHGGDEFAILLSDIHDQRDALRAGTAIIEALSAPFRVDGQDSFLSASIGIAVHPHDGDTVDELLKKADTAMYRAKKAGRAQVMFFEERMNAETLTRLTVDRELRAALPQGQLELYFQPLVFLDSERIVAAEALLRWRHPRRGLVSAGEFIGIAEESGLINTIGKWVIETACAQVAQWRSDGLGIEKVAVNVSARQLRDPSFVEHIRRHVVDAGLTSAIEFEVTETAMMEQPELARASLGELAAAGCSIALDDFGTGFSSLAYLKQLPVRVVKIDRSFVDDIDRSAESLTFVESIIAMAHAMGKIVVAEGVENSAQARLLQGFGCDLVQGYHFGRPIAAADFPAFIAHFHADHPASAPRHPSRGLNAN